LVIPILIKLVKFIFFLFIILGFSFSVLGQDKDSSYQKKALTTVEVQAFYAHYRQEGKHSAVTGGLGDEQLEVNHAGTSIKVGINASTIIFNANIDVVTSPSTDKIDFVKSSASLEDRHVYGSWGYQYKAKKIRAVFGAMHLFSMESDYLSNGVATWFSIANKNQDRQFTLRYDMLFDDLRWGRLNVQVRNRPTRLVYPYELRDEEWLDIHHRHTYRLSAAVRQDINKRLRMNLVLGTTYEEGVLSTPFHRVYLAGRSEAVIEQLPRHRLRLPVSVAANWFVHHLLILKANYRFYWDNFGIWANTVQLQAVIKAHQRWSIYPNFRVYHQTASPFFAPYGEHSPFATYFTSDYDYSNFWAFKGGIALGWFPNFRLGKKAKIYFDHLRLRYGFYYRTDGLHAHMISLQVGIK